MLRSAIVAASMFVATAASANIGLTIGELEIGIFDRYRTEEAYSWRTEVVPVRPRRRFGLRRGFICDELGDCEEILIPSRRRFLPSRPRELHIDY